MKIKVIYLLLILIFIFSCSKEQKNFNLVIISIDTLRADHLSCYNYKYKTSPNIDKFSRKSTLFKYAFCPIPKTSASFTSMLTGLHPFIHKTKPNRGFLKKKYDTLAEILKKEGYNTYAIVDNANLSSKYFFNQGFDNYVEVWQKVKSKRESTPFITKKTLQILKNAKHPFFLWINYIETHTPYQPPKIFIEKRPKGRNILKIKKKIIAGMRKEIKKFKYEGIINSLYDASIKYVDYEIGKILNYLFNNGFNKDTIIIINADHGEDLGDYNFFYNHGSLPFTSATRIPLIIYIPWLKNSKRDYIVSNMDLLPTILDLKGLKSRYKLQGHNLFKPNKNRILYIYTVSNSFAVLRHKYSYINLSKKITNFLGLSKRNYFFNLFIDPYEKHNIISTFKKKSKSFKHIFINYFNKYRYKISNKKRKKNKLNKKDIKSLKTLGYL